MLLDAPTRISKNASYSVFNSHRCFGMIGFTFDSRHGLGELGASWMPLKLQYISGFGREGVLSFVLLLLSHALPSELS